MTRTFVATVLIITAMALLDDKWRNTGSCKVTIKPCQSDAANATLVTAVYDIGRGNWNTWRRPFSEYLSYFKLVLALNVPLAVFVEDDLVPFVQQERKGKDCLTKIYKKKFSELEYFKYRPFIKGILQSDTFREENDMLEHPEAFSADYIIMTNNKISFLEKVAKTNPFQTTHFYWLDAGYGHGTSEIFPQPASYWSPCNLLQMNNKITLINLFPIEHYKELVKIKPLHKQAVSPALNGGFFGGGEKVVKHFAKLYRKIFRLGLTSDVVDDDQGTTLQCWLEQPHLFHLVTGNWYDVFKLFH